MGSTHIFSKIILVKRFFRFWWKFSGKRTRMSSALVKPRYTTCRVRLCKADTSCQEGRGAGLRWVGKHCIQHGTGLHSQETQLLLRAPHRQSLGHPSTARRPQQEGAELLSALRPAASARSLLLPRTPRFSSGRGAPHLPEGLGRPRCSLPPSRRGPRLPRPALPAPLPRR